MEEQLELITEPDKEVLCGYLQQHPFEKIDFKSIESELDWDHIRTIKAWNELNKQDRILTTEDASFTLLACLSEGAKTDEYKSPANKYMRDTYYTDIAHKIGLLPYTVITLFGHFYKLQPWEYEPEEYLKEG